MVSVRTLGSHWLISLSEKNNSELVKWVVIRTPTSKLQHSLLFCFRGLEDLVYIGKKENIGYKQGYFAYGLKLHHPRCYTYLLLFRVLPIAVVACTSICNWDKIPHGNSLSK